MGQFASRHYDGDPYIELMRALPDRELIWWVQKVIWVSAAAAQRRAGTASARLGVNAKPPFSRGSNLAMLVYQIVLYRSHQLRR
jgi:hypothetical protein